MDITEEHVRKCVVRFEVEFLEALKNVGEYSISILFYFTYLSLTHIIVSITHRAQKW